MEEILINCSPGVSGDMLLGAFHDLGVPKEVILKPLLAIGLDNLFSLDFVESQSCSIRGCKVKVCNLEKDTTRNWRVIKDLILKSDLEIHLQRRIYDVFESLAIAEGKVHGINPDDVHFHEIGAIDSLVDVIGVCASIEYIKPKQVFCNEPTLGKGYITTDHGKLSIPSPAVVELLSSKGCKVFSNIDSIEGELTTPTGIALLLNLVDDFQVPYKYSINSYGVGLGNLKLPCPNLIRIQKISSDKVNVKDRTISPIYEEIVLQEAWIDDQSSEDIANLLEVLRNEGAYDVSYQTINMKKNRIGFSVQVILPIEKQEYFRELWFRHSNTLGIRERKQSRWILFRRRGECLTALGKVKFKEIMKPNGDISIKPENDEVLRLQIENSKNSQEIRNIIQESMGPFKAFEDWQ